MIKAHNFPDRVFFEELWAGAGSLGGRCGAFVPDDVVGFVQELISCILT
jgi:hypothetical protein